MPREQLQTLTEPMYYILLALKEECCGVDIMKRIEVISHGRITVGPGTLYALLDKFQKAGLIIETRVEGRKRSYIISEKGYEVLKKEYYRLITMVEEGKTILER
ncbi:PadR family transcriptional regulator [Anaerobium acetethylicum]|uniref:Transcriptional regulator PadR-like family protein n=1 Tax=Anaerobium acetethylicum TaxID=1619234 RepID=A0A1D3TXA6_9FIRM|nr:PadR family transcriptional regulator [Anaerobium acetethylicum]SCP98969.1 Transcriptional regulator PadR-like family protein [Anaerobium acetethylicum]